MLTEKSIRRLSSQLGADLGVGISSQEFTNLAHEHSANYEHLADAILVAGGLDPQLVDRHLYRQIRGMIQAESLLAEQEQSRAGT